MQDKRDELDELLFGKLHNFELPPPKNGWEQIKVRVPQKRKVIGMWKVAMGAAAVALLLITVGVRLNIPLQSDDSIAEVESTDIRSLTDLPTAGAEQPIVQPSISTEKSTIESPLLATASKSGRRSDTPVQQAAFNNQPSATALQTEVVEEKAKPIVAVAEAKEPPTTKAAESAEKNEATANEEFDLDAYARQLDNESSLTPIYAGKKREESSWSAGLFASNSTSTGGGGSANSPAQHNLRSAVVQINNLLVRESRTEVANFNHSIPLSSGLTVRKTLPNNFALETGLVYTYLGSKASIEGRYGYDLKQHLHYLGIPLTLNYTFFSSKHFSLYAAAGGGMEKCISAVRNTVYKNSTPNGDGANSVSKSFSIKELDWSISAKMGAAYDISKRIGINFEPSLNYYFMSDSKPASYRKDNPLGLSLRVGVFAKF